MLQKLQDIRENKRPGEGFTIIEVMIVLAIAGLILVVVLVAIPQLQRNQRNEARRSTLNRISVEIGNYATNNNGSIPTAGNDTTTGFTGGFQTRYITNAPAGTFDTPGGGAYSYTVTTMDVSTLAEDTVVYRAGATCVGELPNGTGNTRQYAVAVGLEGGAIYCADNG